MAATSLLHLPLPLPDLLPQTGRIPLSLAFQDVLSSPIDLRAGVEGTLPPGLMMNCATARWIGHRWAFSGYIPELMPPLVEDPEFEHLPPPPRGDPPSRAKTRRTQKKKPEPEVASRPSSDSITIRNKYEWLKASLPVLEAKTRWFAV